MIRRAAAALALAAALPWAAAAQQAPAQDRPLDDTGAFERSFAESLYQFDACGDPLAGRMFRKALDERFAHCPFSPDARSRFAQRARAEQAKVRRTMERLVEANGGLPTRLEGMSTTCHAMQASDEYRNFRGRLERYAQGEMPADAVIPAPCDAADLVR